MLHGKLTSLSAVPLQSEGGVFLRGPGVVTSHQEEEEGGGGFLVLHLYSNVMCLQLSAKC